MIRRRALFCLLSAMLAAFSAPVRAAADPLESVLHKLREAEASVKTLRFSFVQKTLVVVTGEEQVLRGRASFLKPDRFRVEHLSPRPLTAVSDGKTLWIHNPARNQVMADKWDNWAASAGFPRGLSFFQEGSADLRKKYDITLEKDGSLTCVPKDKDAWPYTLRVWPDAASGLPLKTELFSQSLRTVTEVTDMEVNPALPDATFTFTPPAGAEVFGTPATHEDTPQ